MSVIFSPSGMAQYRNCPRKYQAQSITYEIEWQDTPQKARGIAVHEAIEKYMYYMLEPQGPMPNLPHDIQTHFVRQRVQSALDFVGSSGKFMIEKEMAVTSGLLPAPWKSDDTLLRCRADALLIAPEKFNAARIIDIKTGKKWDKDAFQLRVEAILVLALFKIPFVQYEFWYVDTGELVQGLIDFNKGTSQVRDIMDLIKEMRRSVATNYFPAKKNKFCRWCPLTECPNS